MNGPAVLLFERCPTGQHIGAVAAEANWNGQLAVPWPPRYVCGCVDPRRQAREEMQGREAWNL